MKIKLTPRLQKIVELIPPDSRVVDIGTDHGYIPIYLLQNKITTNIIASDLNKKPFKIAKRNIQEYGFSENVKLRLGSGLNVLKPGEVDIIIMAGMGGILISELLEDELCIAKGVNSLILQPMRGQEELRKNLIKMGFRIDQDLLVKEDGGIYEIIVARKGNQVARDEIYYEIGFHLKTNPKSLAQEFISRKIKIQEEILDKTKVKNTPDAIDKYQECKDKIVKLGGILKWLES